jgi:hypothetical protein
MRSLRRLSPPGRPPTPPPFCLGGHSVGSTCRRDEEATAADMATEDVAATKAMLATGRAHRPSTGGHDAHVDDDASIEQRR